MLATKYICVSFDESDMMSNYYQDLVIISNLYYERNLLCRFPPYGKIRPPNLKQILIT